MQKLISLQNLNSFFQQKYWCIWDINVWNFNKNLTNNVISCEQPMKT